jgi:hypothetical protein
MAGISLITNFNINAFAPIDSRIVATNSTMRDNIQYKYEGLKVYDLSDKKTYNWTGVTWSIDGGNGIYGGSGSLVGDTVVDMGTISLSPGSKSHEFWFGSSTSTTQMSFRNYFQNNSGNFEWRNEFFTETTLGSYQHFKSNSIELGVGTNRRFTMNNDSSVSVSNGSFDGKISSLALTGNRTYSLPNIGGTFALVSDLTAGIQNLQSVTTIGNTTSQGFSLLGSTMTITKSLTDARVGFYFGPTAFGVSTDYFSPSSWGVSLESFGSTIDSNQVVYKQGTYSLNVRSSTLTSTQTIRFPDSSGIVRLLDDTNSVGFSLGTTNITTSGQTISVGNQMVNLIGNSGMSYNFILPSASINLGSILIINVVNGTWTNVYTSLSTTNGFYISSNADAAISPNVTFPPGITRMIATTFNGTIGAGWFKW